jgi:hypothetical protein
MTECEGTIQEAGFKDCKTRLVVFGILQIMLGSLFALAVPMIILGMIAVAVSQEGRPQQAPWPTMTPAILFYALLAAWFIVMGIGSIRARRWARALVLTSSWLWLACGVVGFAFILWLVPVIYDQMAQSGEIPAAAIIIMKYAMMAFAAVFYVVIPGLLVLFYSGRNVKATCECRDTRARWTDQCPLPVLGVSMVCVFWTVSVLSMGLYGWVFPFFGTILCGIPGAVVIGILALLFAYAAWGMYRLDIKAWWCVLLTHVGWLLSSVITFSRVSMQTFYEKMNLPRQTMEQMERFIALGEKLMVVPMMLWIVVVVVYLLCIRKYFTPPSAASRIYPGSHTGI